MYDKYSSHYSLNSMLLGFPVESRELYASDFRDHFDDLVGFVTCHRGQQSGPGIC
jgi:hypothetical protein